MPRIRRIRRLDLALKPATWGFAEANRAAIDAHFVRIREQKPAVWNGRVMLCRDPRADGEVYRADYFETDFASFLAWRDWSFPDKSVFNGFGAGALRSADGAFVLGRMAPHTANAGRIYFPAGTPDPDDIVGDRIDLAASVARETEEEVGLKPADYAADDGWTVVETGQVVACFRRLNSALDADQLKQRIEAFILAETLAELNGITLVRSVADFNPAMPEFTRAYLADALAG